MYLLSGWLQYFYLLHSGLVSSCCPAVIVPGEASVWLLPTSLYTTGRPPTQPICSECTIQFGLNPGLSCTYYSSVASSVLALANDSLLFDFNLPEHLKGRFGAVCPIILKLVTTFASRGKDHLSLYTGYFFSLGPP